MSGVLLVAAGVATPLALVGLVAALGYFAYSRQMRYQEKKLEALPPEERAARTDEYLTRYGIDGKKLKVADKLALIRDEMEKRHRRSLSYVIIAAAVFVICFALSVAAYVVANSGGEVVDTRPRRLHGHNPESLNKASFYLTSNAPNFLGMQEAIGDLRNLAFTGDGQFFCSDPLDSSRTNPTVIVKGIPGSEDHNRLVEVRVFVPKSRSDPDMKQSTDEIHGNIATLKLNGNAPEGSVVFAAYWVEGDENLDVTQLDDFTQLEVYLQ